MDIIHKLYSLSKSYDQLKEHKYLIDEQKIIDQNMKEIVPVCPNIVANLMLAVRSQDRKDFSKIIDSSIKDMSSNQELALLHKRVISRQIGNVVNLECETQLWKCTNIKRLTNEIQQGAIGGIYME